MLGPHTVNRSTLLWGICAVPILFLLVPPCEAGQGSATRADAKALCSFITGKMQSALPQVPTLCAPVTDTAGDPYALPSTLVVSVFSPTDVLQGKMRRAWSTALFQTAQALLFAGALDGACESTRSVETPGEIPMCELRVSDSSLSQSGLYYRVSLTGAQGRFLALAGDPASESVYENWWETLEAGQTTRYPARGSMANGELIAQEACKEFETAYGRYWRKFPMGSGPGPSTPGCSVMLATDTGIYIALDFAFDLYAIAENNAFPILDAFGETFDHSGYDGAVIFRTAWSEGGNRLYRMYSLHDIEFWWEEAHAGVTDKPGAAAKLSLSAIEGQYDRHAFSPASRKTASGETVSTLRISAVVRVTPVPGSDFVLVDLTDGSEWSFPAKAPPGCGLTPGTTLMEVGGGKNSSQATPFGNCKSLSGTFVQGW